MTTFSQDDNRIVSRRKESRLTKHAAIRGQQRSIPQAVIDYLIDFGESEQIGGSCQRHGFTKRSWRKFLAYLGTEARHYERYRFVYVVTGSDGAVITSAWKH